MGSGHRDESEGFWENARTWLHFLLFVTLESQRSAAGYLWLRWLPVVLGRKTCITLAKDRTKAHCLADERGWSGGGRREADGRHTTGHEQVVLLLLIDVAWPWLMVPLALDKGFASTSSPHLETMPEMSLEVRADSWRWWRRRTSGWWWGAG
jgi:hypothetical protein